MVADAQVQEFMGNHIVLKLNLLIQQIARKRNASLR